MSQSTSDHTRTRESSESDHRRLLAAERRRTALDVLSNRTGPVGLEAVATAIATREADRANPPREHVDRVALTLHHVHLPTMSEVGIVRYDWASRRIEAVDVPGGLP
ncbi:MAG TPA: hypothetical protein VKA37_03470 [Halobacteriales archaeon]|nr:hypothetical protein [Halobacteriales archaeon]